jgi:serine/threonine protein kinase
MRSSIRVNRRPPTEAVTRGRAAGPLDAAALLAENPGLWADRSAVVDLVYEEYCQRWEAGEVIDADSFCARFPEIQDSLHELLSAHQFLLARLESDDSRAAIPWPQAGASFLGFDLRRELGRGAFARVFLAAEPALGHRLVAVKIAPHGATEAETLGRLQHPHIVPIHSVGVDTETGLSAVCMPYLGQATLCDVLDRVYRGPEHVTRAAVFLETALAPRDADPCPGLRSEPDAVLRRGTYREGVALIGLELAEALAYTHAQGVCHGDLKPSNVLLSPDGRPLLLDFNLSLDRQLVARVLGGTLPYMAPEQLRALGDPSPDRRRAIDGRSDLFSLGVILYELVTGKLPFGPVPRDRSAEELRDDILERQARGVPPLRHIEPDVEAPLARVIERCLALEPADRLQTAAELAAALRGFLSPWQRLRRQARSRWRTSLAACLTFVVLGAGGAWHLAIQSARGDSANDRAMSAGLDSFRHGEYDSALHSFTHVIQADPACAHAYFARARVYQRLAEQEIAREDDCRQRAKPRPPAEANALLAEATAAKETRMRLMHNAERDCKEASEHTDDGRVFAVWGYCLAWQQYHQAAVAQLREAQRRGYCPAEVCNDLAFCGSLNSMPRDEVVQLLAQAQAHQPTLSAIEATRTFMAVRHGSPVQAPPRRECLVDPVKNFPD